jgi:hypothetical protein
MKFRLMGDICHPGSVIIEAENLQALLDIFTPECNMLNDEAHPFSVADEQSSPLMFVWDGPIFDENDNEIDLSQVDWPGKEPQ